MATAAEILVPLRSGLVPVPRAGQGGIWRICLSGCDPRYQQCYPCHEASGALGGLYLLPISLSLDGDLLHRHLRGYKDDRNPGVRARMSTRLAALLAVFMNYHSACVGDFDSIALVPSPNRVAMEDVLRRLPAMRGSYVPTLTTTGLGSKGELSVDRFDVGRGVTGERILVLDDTFTRGPTLFSAVAALQQAGAQIVGPVVLGRHVQPTWGPSGAMLSWLGDRVWDETRCSRCNGEAENPGRLW